MIYLDNSATTKPSAAAVAAALDVLTDNFANPSSRHMAGICAARTLDTARNQVASALCVNPGQIIFTSGGTESNNLAIFGGINKKIGKHIVTTAVEHPSVSDAMKRLESDGFEVTYIKPDATGTVSASDIISAVRPDTVFVSVMHINNETGAVMPIEKLSAGIKCRAPRAMLHCDAVQSFGKLPVLPAKWDVDFLTVSSHKIHGPKGAGALYVKNPGKLSARTAGGSQERTLRSGTENLPGIAGFGAAAQDINPSRDSEIVKPLYKKLCDGILSLPDVCHNGSVAGSPYILNVSFIGVRSEIMLNALSQDGICVSAGSACSESAHKKSPVLDAMGAKYPDCAIRFSLSASNTEDEIDTVILKVKNNLERLR